MKGRKEENKKGRERWCQKQGCAIWEVSQNATHLFLMWGLGSSKLLRPCQVVPSESPCSLLFRLQYSRTSQPVSLQHRQGVLLSGDAVITMFPSSGINLLGSCFGVSRCIFMVSLLTPGPQYTPLNCETISDFLSRLSHKQHPTSSPPSPLFSPTQTALVDSHSQNSFSWVDLWLKFLFRAFTT